MEEKNILDQLIRIQDLVSSSLESHFKELNYYCIDKDDDYFIFKSSLPIPAVYLVMTSDKMVNCCIYKITGTLDSTKIHEYAISDYNFVNIPINEPSSFILDNHRFRLSIRIVDYNGLNNQITITLSKRGVPFGYRSNFGITMELLPNVT